MQETTLSSRNFHVISNVNLNAYILLFLLLTPIPSSSTREWLIHGLTWQMTALDMLAVPALDKVIICKYQVVFIVLFLPSWVGCFKPEYWNFHFSNVYGSWTSFKFSERKRFWIFHSITVCIFIYLSAINLFHELSVYRFLDSYPKALLFFFFKITKSIKQVLQHMKHLYFIHQAQEGWLSYSFYWHSQYLASHDSSFQYKHVMLGYLLV